MVDSLHQRQMMTPGCLPSRCCRRRPIEEGLEGGQDSPLITFTVNSAAPAWCHPSLLLRAPPRGAQEAGTGHAAFPNPADTVTGAKTKPPGGTLRTVPSEAASHCRRNFLYMGGLGGGMTRGPPSLGAGRRIPACRRRLPVRPGGVARGRAGDGHPPVGPRGGHPAPRSRP